LAQLGLASIITIRFMGLELSLNCLLVLFMMKGVIFTVRVLRAMLLEVEFAVRLLIVPFL
jgi:hypothetical protein